MSVTHSETECFGVFPSLTIDFHCKLVRVDEYLATRVLLPHTVRRYNERNEKKKRHDGISIIDKKLDTCTEVLKATKCFYLAPCSRSNSTTLPCPLSAAHCNAVLPRSSFSSTSAPCSSSMRTAGSAP